VKELGNEGAVFEKVDCKGPMFVIKIDHRAKIFAIKVDQEGAIFVRYSSLNNKSLGMLLER
jgi:hypothetical protein